MDPTTLFLVLQPAPVVVDRQAVTWRGSLVPLVLPLDGLSASTRAQILLAHEGTPLDVRVNAALDAGLTDATWALVIRNSAQKTRSASVDLVLSLWAAREQARLALPATRDPWLLLTANGRPPPGLEPAIAMNTTREMLSGLSWPRWSGPLVLIFGDLADKDPIPGRSRLVRPALPMVRVGEQTGMTRSEAVCLAITDLALDLEAPPAAGWPAWLRVGLGEVVKAKMRGEGPSPLKMLGLRQRAGVGAIAELLLATKPNAELAGAICAPLVHTRRRHLLGNLLDLLRGGAQSTGALQVAYGMTLQQLTEER